MRAKLGRLADRRERVFGGVRARTAVSDVQDMAQLVGDGRRKLCDARRDDRRNGSVEQRPGQQRQRGNIDATAPLPARLERQAPCARSMVTLPRR